MSNYQKEDIEKFSEIFKALSNTNRLNIFLRLVSCCVKGKSCNTENIPTCAGDIGSNMDIAPSTLSHHLKELRNAGLIHMKRRGQNMECWVEENILHDLAGFFSM